MSQLRENDSDLCECGNPKTKRSFCCARCAFMDGQYVMQMAVISELRDGEVLTIAQIVNAIPGSCYRSVLRTLQALERSGRVRTSETPSRCSKPQKLYTLIDRPERATA